MGKNMDKVVEADLADAQDCKAVDMIKFLLAFCQSGNGKTVPVHNECLLQRAFEKMKEVANQERTPLKTNLDELLNAQEEADMYGPFADACNNALNELSRLQVEGLPHFSDRIVFVRVEQSVQSQHSARKNWPRPDIVLMSWELFNLSKESPYFTLDEQDIFIDKSDTELLWSEIRSTVEIEFMGSPKHDGWKTFDMEFGTLIESEAYTSLTVNDDCDEPQFIEENLPNYHYYYPERSDGLVAEDEPRTGESPGIPASQVLNVPMQSREHCKKGVPVDIQNGIYAAERLSCSLGMTHSINFILRGTTIYITWSDRQSVIRTGGFDIIDNLPHFLLILLIVQRFDLGRWGLFSEFEGSEIRRAYAYPELGVLDATFIANKPINIVPHDDVVYGEINLVGRSTTATGARDAAYEVTSTFEDNPNGNNLIVKFSWPEETRVSEVEVIERAERIGKTNELVRGHIPEILGNIDPPYLTCSTSIIRTFLGLDTAGARVLRVIVFPRLEMLGYLDEENMLMGFLDCFFCHWALWCEGIQHGDICIGNLMYNPVTKRGVLNDFGSARICTKGENWEPTGKESTGTMAFMALDLLGRQDSQGMVPRLYRHDAESFAWCLIYICICIGKCDGETFVLSPHPLRLWFKDPQTCRSSKEYETWELFEEDTIHNRCKPLAKNLFNHWVNRFHRQKNAELQKIRDAYPSPPPMEGWPAHLFAKFKRDAPKKDVYEESSELESFGQVCQLLIDTSGATVPESKVKHFVEKVNFVVTSYGLVEPPGPAP